MQVPSIIADSSREECDQVCSVAMTCEQWDLAQYCLFFFFSSFKLTACIFCKCLIAVLYF
jgi:hypothetical protein